MIVFYCLLSFFMAFHIEKLIEKHLIAKLSNESWFKKNWNSFIFWILRYFSIAIGIFFILQPICNSLVREQWVETPPLSKILNEHNNTLNKLSITEIEVGTKSWLLEYKGGKLIKTNGHGNVTNGYEVETNGENLYVTEAYLLRGFRASYINGVWVAKVPESVTSRDVEVAKEQVIRLVSSIDKHYKKVQKNKSSWE